MAGRIHRRLTIEELEPRVAPVGDIFAPAVAYDTGGISPSGVAAGDFNGDGFADLAAANNSTSTVGVLLSNGNGTFQPAATFGPGGSGPTALTPGDFNHDGNLDIAVINSSSIPAANKVGVLLGNGNGTFRTAVALSPGVVNPVALTAADFNNDGIHDLAVASNSDDRVSVLLSNGNGTFKSAVVSIASGAGPNWIAAGDFNHDGKTDVAVTLDSGLSTRNVSVLLGCGNGKFAPAVLYDTGQSGPNAVAVGDFNGDGKPDLSVTHPSNNDVAVLLGNGNGTFKAPISSNSGGVGPVSLALGDFTRDGKTDVATANAASFPNDVGVLLGNGNGTFAADAAVSSGGTGAVQVVVGDFNNDFRDDLAVADSSSNTVGVLMNVYPPLVGGPLTSPAPTALDLAPDSDTGISSSDYLTCLNNSLTKTLEFSVAGTIPGATVTLYCGGQSIGSALATGTATTIRTNGAVPLAEGLNSVTARQTVPGQSQSLDSPALNITVDTVAPLAVLSSAGNITTGGGTTYGFAVTYADDMAIDVSDLDITDVLVTGPYGYSQLATFDGVTPPGAGTPRTATYHITAPSWTWEETDDGAYTVAVQADQVTDIAGNYAPGGSLGSFTVDIEGADLVESCVLSSPTTLDLSLGFDAWQVVDDGEGGQVIVLPGFDQRGDPGEPLLPEASIFLGLPSDTDLDSLVLSILGSTQSSVPGIYGIAPGAPAATIGADGETVVNWGPGKEIVNGRDVLVYESDSFYGAPTVQLLSGEQMGKWKIAEIVYAPFEYNPVSGSLRVTNDISLRVSFDTDELLPDGLALSTLSDSDAAGLLENYQQASVWYPAAAVADRAATVKPGYAILTTSAVKSNLKQLDAFVKQKELMGYQVSVVTENSGGPDSKGWGGGTGDAAAEKMRSWLKANYDAKHMNIQYALLIGNPDPGSGDVPMKMTYPSSDDFRTFAKSTSASIVANGETTSTLSVTDKLNINDIVVTVNITCAQDQDLTVSLESPSGASVVLFSGVGGTSGNFTSTILDGLATTPITSGSALAPFTGRFRPTGNLSDFFDTTTKGTWSLKIANTGGSTQGTLNSWSIMVVPDDCKSPTDYYYANLTEDWDKNKDLRFGEWGASYDIASVPTSQIAVGRIPIYAANYSAGDAILAKTVAYEVSQDRTWRNSILLPAAISDFANENDKGNDRADEFAFVSAIKTNIADPAGWSSVLMAELSGLAPVTAGAGVLAIGGDGPNYKSNVITQWKDNKYGFVTWSGHGSETGTYRKVWVSDTAGDGIPMSAEIAEPSFIMNTDCPSLNNSYPSFVMEVSCNNAYPENPNNLAYSLLKNGAVVTVASTRVSHYNTGAWTTSTADRYGDNDGFGYYLTKYMVAYPTCGVGTALNWVRSKLGTGWKSHSWMNLTDHNVYGDPSLGLNTGV